MVSAFFYKGTCLPLANTESHLRWFLQTTIEVTLMKSPVIKRSVMIDGHKTSVSLEDAFWSGLKEIARAQQATLSNTVAEIDKARQHGNLSSAIRLFVLDRVANRVNVATVETASYGTGNGESAQQVI